MLIFDNLENQPVEVLVLGHNNHPKIDKVEVQIKLANTKKIQFRFKIKTEGIWRTWEIQV